MICPECWTRDRIVKAIAYHEEITYDAIHDLKKQVETLINVVDGIQSRSDKALAVHVIERHDHGIKCGDAAPKPLVQTMPDTHTCWTCALRMSCRRGHNWGCDGYTTDAAKAQSENIHITAHGDWFSGKVPETKLHINEDGTVDLKPTPDLVFTEVKCHIEKNPPIGSSKPTHSLHIEWDE